MLNVYNFTVVICTGACVENKNIVKKVGTSEVFNVFFTHVFGAELQDKACMPFSLCLKSR